METRVDRKRGCGYRQPGGLYLMGGGFTSACGKLPVPLERCPTCDHGIKFSRSWTWVDGSALLNPIPCVLKGFRLCDLCPASNPGRCGLLWIGAGFYKTPNDWLLEACKLGISRRIANVPKGFRPNETVVLVAHIAAIDSLRLCDSEDSSACEICNGTGRHRSKGIFSAFIPTHVEYVVKGDETEEKLADLEKRGIIPVEVIQEP